MTNEEMVQFINQQKSIGASKDQVAGFLRSVGFSDQQVDDAWESTGQTPSSPANSSVTNQPSINQEAQKSNPITAGWTPEKSSKNGKKVILGILIILVIILVGAGGAFAYLQYLQSEPTSNESGSEILKQMIRNLDTIESFATISEINIKTSVDTASSYSNQRAEAIIDFNQSTKNHIKDLISEQNMNISFDIDADDVSLRGNIDVDSITNGQNFYLKINNLQLSPMISAMLPPMDKAINQWIGIINDKNENEYAITTNYKDAWAEMVKTITDSSDLTENDLEKILTSINENFWNLEVINIAIEGQEIIGGEKTYHLVITPNIQNIKPFILKTVEDNAEIFVRLNEGQNNIQDVDDLMEETEKWLNELETQLEKNLNTNLKDITWDLITEIWIDQKDFWPRRITVNADFTGDVTENKFSGKIDFKFSLNTLIKNINQPQSISIPETYKSLEEIIEDLGLNNYLGNYSTSTPSFFLESSEEVGEIEF